MSIMFSLIFFILLEYRCTLSSFEGILARETDSDKADMDKQGFDFVK